MDNNVIICADSQEYLQTIPNESIDLIFTSPPYNFGMEYDNTNDSLCWSSYYGALSVIFRECERVLKHGGRIAVNVQPLYSEYARTHHYVANLLEEKGLIWRNEILWEKNHYNCKYTSWGSWKSPSSPYMKYTWEFIEVFSKGDIKMQGDKNNADISGDDFKKWVYGKWSIAPERRMKNFEHPAMFPEELARRVLQLFSFKGANVLDPFCGIGTTCVVAKKLDRNYIGIDISEEYCKKAQQRIESI